MGVCLSKTKKSSSDLCLWVQLNEDLCTEILKRLPIKLVCRIRCVCKAWNSLITSSLFISHHHLYYNSINNNNKSFFLFNDTEWSYALHNPQESAEIRVRPVPFQRGLTPRVEAVVGVTRGIVCVSPVVCHSADSTVLWNPTINKYLEIPPSSTFHGSGASSWRDVGCGYDAVKNDFKVVRSWWSSAQGRPRVSMFEVFSTRDWRRTNVDAYQFSPFTLASAGFIYKTGVIHWIIKRYINNVHDDVDHHFVWALLTFDCGLGEFKTIELPQQWKQQHRRVEPFQLGVYCGMLYVATIETELVLHINRQPTYNLGTWVMEECGVESSWNKLLSKFDRDNRVDSSTLQRYTDLWETRYQRSVIQPSMFFYGRHFCMTFMFSYDLKFFIMYP